MEIKKTLTIPASVFYEKIIQSVLYDIRRHTDKTLNQDQLADFEYTKTFSKNSRAKIKIEKAEKDRCYSYRTLTVKNEYYACYEIQALDDHSCRIIYKETMDSFGILQKLNDTLLGALTGYFKKRQFIQMIEMIENS